MTDRLQSACPLDCPDGCSLEVHVDQGRVIRLDGSGYNPTTNGYICSKVRRFGQHIYSDERILKPALRAGPKGRGDFTPVDWDTALGHIAERLDEVRRRFGGEAILPFGHGGSNGALTQGSVDARLFYRLGASQLARTVCAAPTGAALLGLYGGMPGVSFSDYEQAKLIVIWGANPSATNIHLLPPLKAARAKGAKVVVVDPRRIPLADRADLHLAVRPGTDLVIALALIAWLFENGHADEDFLREHTVEHEQLRERSAAWTLERAASVAGVSVQDLEAFAQLYATLSPAVIRCGWGLERNRNGGSAAAAIMALPAVAGKFGVRGGGFSMMSWAVWDFPWERGINAQPPATRTVNMNRLGETLLSTTDDPVKALFIYNANPLATLPAQAKVRAGLAREDLFTVVFDQVHTDTARYADVLLPATTFLEHHDLRPSYGTPHLARLQPVVDPVGDARPNYSVFAELIDRLGLVEVGDPVEPESLVAAMLGQGEESERVKKNLAETGAAAASCGSEPVQFVDVFPATGDRKINLCPANLDREAQGLYHFRTLETPNYPLTLISPALRDRVSSMFGQLSPQQAAVELHPDDAKARQLSDGESVRVFNKSGEVHCKVRINPRVRTGVAVLPKGLWSRETANGATANVFAPDTLADLGGGACFNDARVEVARR